MSFPKIVIITITCSQLQLITITNYHDNITGILCVTCVTTSDFCSFTTTRTEHPVLLPVVDDS